MFIEIDCTIIFDEKDDIPFQIELEDQKSKQYHAFPLSLDKFGILQFISQTQQLQLQKKIEYMKKYIDFVQQPLENTQRITQKIQKNIEDVLPTDIFGPKSLQPNAGQYGFQKEFCTKIIQPKQEQSSLLPGSNVAILIYQNEDFESLNHQMEVYNNQYKVKPIVLINGKSAFKKLMRSKEDFFLNFYQTKYLPFHQKFMTSTHHCIYFQIKGQIGYYFVFARELNKLDLIKWVYQGILKLIQPKFVAIASSNEIFSQEINIIQLFEILAKEPKYFGIQCFKKLSYKGRFWNTSQGNFADIAFKIDSMFKIKQFHNPLSCIYQWERIEPTVDDYIRMLDNEQIDNSWALGYNSILPRLMNEHSGKELKFITQCIVEQKFNENQFENVFNQFCQYKRNINDQLRKCRFHLFRNVFQWFIAKIQVFHNYFAISICLFFSFQCPYQLIYNLLDESVGYTALAVALPILYSINILLFLLLTQLYHFNDKIIEKGYQQEVALMGQKNEKQEFSFKTVNSSNIDIMLMQEQNEYNIINFEIQEDEYIEKGTKEIKKEQMKENELFYLYKFPQLKYISLYMGYIIETQNYLDFGVVLFIYANLILVHGRKIINEQSEFEIALWIMAFITFLYQLITKRLGIVWLFVRFSMISYFWQFFQLPRQITSARQRSNEKRKLGSQLLLNFILFYTFIAIESYYNYCGYILIGLFGYLAIVDIIIGFFQFTQYLCYSSSIPKSENQIWEGKLLDGIPQILDNKIHQQANTQLFEMTRRLQKIAVIDDVNSTYE
ncbi:unnamed protein product (macronuclear) [Paramecium tetraurelia]|uniref:Transmembrane protein n=1 Tax=Paramecium tetraurelia TaxID=5888 RepID=A0EBD8_PARTE|nr:uncharacterized protein GSPATT00025339001 [Paramecium tetraurelia]CAK92605.1 unnamed protein product [Paramecium tetraurelia]|eukprot:XP_001460002.1 hypothetical protein (macronuclear) [Paramecium tetraurelia strain d4-2]